MYNGNLYHSKKESAYAQELDLSVKAKDIKGWDRQIKIDLSVNGFHICNYFIDFVVYYKFNITEYVEVKGFETDVWKLKWKLFEALYSGKKGVKLTVIK
jgi:hypothetical protein